MDVNNRTIEEIREELEKHPGGKLLLAALNALMALISELFDTSSNENTVLHDKPEMIRLSPLLNNMKIGDEE